ncbi:MAG: zinc-dependent alcohol dehydrogenase [bacterium]
MKAVVKYAKGQGMVELREVPVPTISEDEVLIEVKVVSVCGSDIHIYHDAHPYRPPMILGHEFSGVIAKVGENVRGWRVGEEVVSETSTLSCGECFYCRSGNPQICPQKGPPGIGRDGAYAKYLAMPQELLHRKPPNISFELAALAEPSAICVHSIYERTGIQPGDNVVIMGPGPIGLISLALCKIAGAGKVIVSGTPRSADLKLAKARELGADVTVNIGEENLEEVVLRETGGLGADLVIDTSGSESAISSAFRFIRRHGRFCAIGISGRDSISIPWDVAVFKAFKLTFCFSSHYTSWETVLRLMGSGRLNLEPIITLREPIENWEGVYRALEEGRAIKAVLYP